MNVASIDMQSCDQCGGVALSHQAFVAARAPDVRPVLGRFDEHRATQFAKRDSDPMAYLPCPACDQSMARRNFEKVSGVIVDQCPQHAVWFDVGELGRCLLFLEQGGEERRRAFEDNEREYLRQQRLRLRWLDGQVPTPHPGWWDV